MIGAHGDPLRRGPIVLARSATTELTVDPNRDQTSLRAVDTELHQGHG